MQKDTKVLLIAGLVIAVAIIGSVVLFAKSNSGPGQLDQFATCLKDKGAVFYGAFWCGHCQSTKKLFGNSAKLLPYVECSTPSGSGQLQVCEDKKIESYPTWIFSDGSQLKGEVSLQILSEKTSCQIIPIEIATIATSTIEVGTSSSALK